MNEPLIGIYSAFVNLIVHRLRKINVESVIVRDLTNKIGMKIDDGQLFDGMIGLVQENVSVQVHDIFEIHDILYINDVF